jgi:hypothetical protein
VLAARTGLLDARTSFVTDAIGEEAASISFYCICTCLGCDKYPHVLAIVMALKLRIGNVVLCVWHLRAKYACLLHLAFDIHLRH